MAGVLVGLAVAVGSLAATHPAPAAPLGGLHRLLPLPRAGQRRLLHPIVGVVGVALHGAGGKLAELRRPVGLRLPLDHGQLLVAGLGHLAPLPALQHLPAADAEDARREVALHHLFGEYHLVLSHRKRLAIRQLPPFCVLYHLFNNLLIRTQKAKLFGYAHGNTEML